MKKRWRKFIDVRALLLLLVAAVWAGWIYTADPAPQMLISTELANEIDAAIDIPPHGLDWKILAQTKENSAPYTDDQGFTGFNITPTFSDTVKKLDGKTVILKGYMFPLEEGETQKLFLLGPFMPDCPDHYHVGASLVVEVHAQEAIPFVYDRPVVLKGEFELVDDDKENGAFYRLHHAVSVHD